MSKSVVEEIYHETCGSEPHIPFAQAWEIMKQRGECTKRVNLSLVQAWNLNDPIPRKPINKMGVSIKTAVNILRGLSQEVMRA